MIEGDDDPWRIKPLIAGVQAIVFATTTIPYAWIQTAARVGGCASKVLRLV
jgi:hypothetical protein